MEAQMFGTNSPMMLSAISQRDVWLSHRQHGLHEFEDLSITETADLGWILCPHLRRCRFALKFCQPSANAPIERTGLCTDGRRYTRNAEIDQILTPGIRSLSDSACSRQLRYS